MRKIIFLFLTVVVIGSMLLIGCGEKTTTTTSTTVKPTTTAATTPKPTTSATVAPKRGGTLRVIGAMGISNLSWVAKQNMTDETQAKAFAETLVYYAGTGDFLPELAKSWDIDTTAKTLTFHLQQGVKFHDGTAFNAEAVRWNVQNLIDAKRLANGQYVDSIEVVDEYTFRYHLNAMVTPSIMLHSFGYNLQTMFSPTAFEVAGGANGGGIEWMTNNFCSTSAFKFGGWTQDVTLKLVRNDDYWRGKEFPYLDAIEYTYSADPTISKAKIEAGEADVWGGLPLKEATDLEKAGFKLVTGVGGFYSDLIPDNVSEGSVWKDKNVREALEYAIDREALAAGLGYGKLKAVTQCGGPPTSQGYNKDFKVRAYNVQKAKELLAAAGFSSGFKTTMLVMQGGSQDMATAIQANLAEVGITVTIDIADPGRFIGAIFGGGWNGGLLAFSVPVDPEFAIGWFVHFGPQPIFPYPSLKWPDEYRALVEKVRLAPTVEAMRAATKDMMTLVSEGAYIIPLIDTLNIAITKKNVHTQIYQEHFMTWHNYMDWIE